MESLNSRIKKLWIVFGLFVGLFLGVSPAIYTFFYLENIFLSVISMVLPSILFIWYAIRRFANWRFDVREEYIEIKKGVFIRVSMYIPYVRVQHIDTVRNPVLRVLGLSSLRVYTAGSKGADITIPGLDKNRAEKIQEQLKQKAIQSEKGFDAV